MNKLVKKFFEELNVVINVLYFNIIGSIKCESDGYGCYYTLDENFKVTDFIDSMAKLKYLLSLLMNILSLCSVSSSEFDSLMRDCIDFGNNEDIKLYNGIYLKEFIYTLDNLRESTNGILSKLLLLPVEENSLKKNIIDLKINVANIYVLINCLIEFLNVDANAFTRAYEVAEFDLHYKYSSLEGYKLIQWMKVENIFDEQ